MPEITPQLITCLRLAKMLIKGKKGSKAIVKENLIAELDQLGDRKIAGINFIPGIKEMLDDQIKLNYCCPNCRKYVPHPKRLETCFYCGFDLTQ